MKKFIEAYICVKIVWKIILGIIALIVSGFLLYSYYFA